MHKAWSTAIAVALIGAIPLAALAETTVLRGSPSTQAASPAPTGNTVNNPSGSTGSSLPGTGNANAVQTGSANAGGEIAAPPVGAGGDVNTPSGQREPGR
jgi:hypothetical protein